MTKRLSPSHEYHSIESIPKSLIHPDNIRDPKTQVRLKQLLASVVPNALAGVHFRRLAAERHIVPEQEGAYLLRANGDGATNLIKSVLMDADLDSNLIEAILLDDLNSIFNPDLHFIRILPQRIDKQSNTYEIYLEEVSTGSIALSQSGSGIKSVILTLLNLIVMPELDGKPVDKCIFALEELENNLHPALLRRLLVYLWTFARTNECPIFLTTHSNVAIDVLSQQAHCQLVHVTRDGEESVCTTVSHFGESRIILDELDVRASDLLQSNGVIWVEGPSDKIYLNRWIELMSKGRLQENVHYQILFYGGKLLSHMTAIDDSEDLISILTVNRNCCIVMDSDLDSESEPIRPTKKRLQDEVESAGGLAWVTKGREIENYIPASVTSSILGKPVKQVTAFAKFDKHIAAIDEKWGKSFAKKKVQFAAEVSSKLDCTNAFDVLDLRQKVGEVCREIAKWNRSADPIGPAPAITE